MASAYAQDSDLILRDSLMPGMRGLKVLENLQANAKIAGIPVIVLTAKDVICAERRILNDSVDRLSRKRTPAPESVVARLHRPTSQR